MKTFFNLYKCFFHGLKMCRQYGSRIILYQFSDLLNLTLSRIVVTLLSADNLCKQFGPRSGPTKLLDTLMVFLKDFFEKVDFKEKSADDKKACKITQHAKS